MHFSNYISRKDAETAISSGVTLIKITPTALKQTPKATVDFLKSRGIDLEVSTERGRPRKLSQPEVERILAIRGSDLSFQKIARIIGVAKSTIFDCYQRHAGAVMSDEYVRGLQLQEARSFLTALLEKDLDEEINEIARTALESDDLAEIERAMRKIEGILQL